jgi:hypothetical protein
LRSRRMHLAADDTLKRRCAMWKTRPVRLHLPGIAPLRRIRPRKRCENGRTKARVAGARVMIRST